MKPKSHNSKMTSLELAIREGMNNSSIVKIIEGIIKRKGLTEPSKYFKEYQHEFNRGRYTKAYEVTVEGQVLFNNYRKKSTRKNVNKDRKTIRDIKKEIKEIHGGEVILEPGQTWKNNYTKMRYRCGNAGCSNTWESTYYNIKKHKCSVCAGVKRKTNKEYNKELLEVYEGTVIAQGDYVNSATPIPHKCTTCNRKWTASPHYVLRVSQGCPNCKSLLTESKGEKIIRRWLDHKNLVYEREKTFSWLINPKTNGRLRLDFYIPALNVAIEYDGEQHRRAVDIYGGEEGLRELQCRDSAKDKVLEEKGIKLIRIGEKDVVEIIIQLDQFITLCS